MLLEIVANLFKRRVTKDKRRKEKTLYMEIAFLSYKNINVIE